jgi:hypothetical protein
MERKQHADKRSYTGSTSYWANQCLRLRKSVAYLVILSGETWLSAISNTGQLNTEKSSPTHRLIKWLSYTVFKNYLQMKSEKS